VDYYEREIPLTSVRAIYEHRVLSDDLLRALNSELMLRDIAKDAIEIGYPFDPYA